MKTEDLKMSVEDKVATFTFNRPDKFNAIVPKFNTLAFYPSHILKHLQRSILYHILHLLTIGKHMRRF